MLNDNHNYGLAYGRLGKVIIVTTYWYFIMVRSTRVKHINSPNSCLAAEAAGTCSASESADDVAVNINIPLNQWRVKIIAINIVPTYTETY